METKTIRTAIAAICVAAALPSFAATKIVTNTIDSVKWRLYIDTSAKTACVGTVPNSGNTSTGNYASHRAFVEQYAYQDKPLYIPATFSVDGVNYTTTRIGNRGFYGGKFNAVTVPANVTAVSYYGFLYCNKLVNILFKGPNTGTNGATQSYKTLSFINNQCFDTNCTGIKFVLIGPGEKLDSSKKANFTFPKASNAKFLVPRSSGNTTWEGISVGGTTPTVIYYGPNEECGYDFWMGTDTITAVPRTLEAMQTVNGYASTFKTAFSHDMRFAITNAIGTLTSDIYSGAGMDVVGEGEITFGLAAAFTGGVTASGTATVSVNAGCRPGNGAVTLDGAATLKVAQSGTVTLGGALTAANGTTLAFNFTEAATAPSLDAAGVTLPADGTVNVKVTADNNFAKGAYTLISGAGLTEGDLAKFTMNQKLSNDWRGALSIVDGDLVLTVKSKPGMMIIVK